MAVKCSARVAVLASIHSALVSTSCWRGVHAHSAWHFAADSKMGVSAYFKSVHIPSFGRAVTGNASDSEMDVSAYFTSVHIYHLLELV